MMDNDDEIKGRLLTRREVVGLLGGLGAVLLAGCTSDNETQPAPASAGGGSSPTATTAGNVSAAATALPSCIVIPELTEGPYFVDEQLKRSDIRSDPGGAPAREGVELTLTLNVLSVAGGSCSALSGSVIDIWHCDAWGRIRM